MLETTCLFLIAAIIRPGLCRTVPGSSGSLAEQQTRKIQNNGGDVWVPETDAPFLPTRFRIALPRSGSGRKSGSKVARTLEIGYDFEHLNACFLGFRAGANAKNGENWLLT
jgi:hypothetical protein